MADVDAVVFGAGGGVGFACVQHMLKNGQRVRAVVRSPDKYSDKFPKDSNLTVAQGGAFATYQQPFTRWSGPILMH